MQRLLILAMMALLPGCGVSDQLVEDLSQNVVHIMYKDRPVGTGGVVRTNRGRVIILTNQHVCKPFQLLKANPNDETGASMFILRVSSSKDLCALTTPTRLKTKGLSLSKLKLRRFQNILVEGYPLMGDLTPSTGRLLNRRKLRIDKDYDLYTTSVHVYPGNSGSPAVDLSGHLVGVMRSASYVSFYGNMIPVDVVEGFLKGL